LTEKDIVHWKIEAVTLIFIVICISFSFYLAFLSFQTLDETLSKQLVAFAASFLITGITIFVALTVHLGIKKAFQRTGDVVKSENTASRNNEY
jgi:creatinine amidohydrolase/Fe(II)-dependent formamide hydrolase-like protein